MKIDKTTKRWIRNESDERAAHNGCRFDLERGEFTVDWMSSYLRLYEGEQAGQALVAVDWAYDCTMRIFGWIKYSERWGRWIRRFNRASIWKPKKNKKSPTLAAWCVYLLAGDGEPGQKVFCGAKDGAQVRENVARHAVEMVMASPELSEECSVNETTMRILHRPSRSVLMPLSSHDVTTQEAKEGLNGSSAIDEVHVVARQFINIIERAGISRSEPLHAEVSTVGKDMESYGYEQWEYGHKVVSGEWPDESFFFDAHAAPQDLTDEELEKDPVKYGKMANPAWGHTVDEEEFLADYQRSKASPRTLADFKMYRLDVWQSSDNPAIRLHDWDACYEAFDEDELAGESCYAAFDLGFTRDTSALVLWFPAGERKGEPVFRLLTKFWLPEATAARESKKVRWRAWHQAGHIKLTSGDTADFPLIRQDIVDCSKKFRIVQLNYDERFAQVLASELQDEHGINVRSFKQSASTYNEPSRTFEKLVLDRRVRHNGNKVMRWQVGNLTWRERGGLLMPDKPENRPLARIDGLSAAIMGLDGALVGEDDDWYEPGILTN